MDRTAAVAYLTEEYNEVASDAGLSSTQIANAYNTALDNSLRQLGFAEITLSTAVVDDSQVIPYVALMEYFTLKRFVRLYALRFNVSVTGAVSASRAQAFDMLTKLLAEAEADLARLGYPQGGVPSFQVGRYDMDYLEPTPAGTEF